MNSTNTRILVVDDDRDIRYAIANILKKCDCHVVEAGSVVEAFDELQSSDFEVVFSDMRFHGGLGGEDLLAHVMEKHPEVQVVMVSCSMDGPQRTDLVSKGAACCLQKPFFRDTCLTVLGNLGHDQQVAA